MISGYAWMPFPILRYVLFFIFGIIFCEILDFSQRQIIISAIIVLLIIIPAFFLKKSQIKQLIQGLGFLSLIFIFGMYVQKYSFDFNVDNQGIESISEIKGMSGVLVSGPKNTAKTNRYFIQIEEIRTAEKTLSTKSKMILYLKKSDEGIFYNYGDKVFVKAVPSKIQGPRNPEDFDFASFMKRKGFEYQIYAQKDDILLISENNGSDLMRASLEAREYFESVLNENIADSNSLYVAKALILGQKNDLPNPIRHAFADAGAIHVLAVSGLHVGIIYQILIYILSFLKRWKYGSAGIFFISVSILFAYALITGFSPSVSRAVIMFSILALSKLISRNSNIYNNLAMAAFIILLANPMMIYDLGFQLSFLAVYSIVFFYPYLTSGFEIDNTWLDKIYKLTAVSIAAQIGTFPITLYYFHQFPNLFVLSNLIVIPFAGIILSLGIAFLAFHAFPFLDNFLAWLLGMSIKIMNEAVFFIQKLPFSVSRDIYFNQWHLIFSILILSALLMILVFRKKKFIYALISLVCCLGLYQWFLSYKLSNQSELVFFSEKEKDYIAFVNGRNMQINFDFSEKENSDFWKYSLSAYTRERAIRTLSDYKEGLFTDNQKFSSWSFGDKIIIKPKENYTLTRPSDYVILDSKNAKVILRSNYIPVKGFILGNNIPYFIRSKIIKELKERNSDFHDLKSEGALVLK